MESVKPKIIDGNGLVFGRMASVVAKQLLKGEHIYIINAENIIISGDKAKIVEKYNKRRSLKNKADPEKSPHYPRVPHMLVKRMIRAMLPWKKARGKAAYKRLKIYNKDEAMKPNFEIPEAKKDVFGITVGELCKELGYNKNY